jgi:hypothetical protein
LEDEIILGGSVERNSQEIECYDCMQGNPRRGGNLHCLGCFELRRAQSAVMQLDTDVFFDRMLERIGAPEPETVA